MKLISNFIIFAVLTLLPAFSVFAQKEEVSADARRVMWEEVNIGERNLYYGPGGTQMQPDLRNMQLLGREEGGTSVKYRVKDAAGREWVAKIGRETQPETAATRLLWAIGYRAEVTYLVPSMQIVTIGNYKNVRLEARPENVKRAGKWSWADNPFSGTKEFDGLKIMVAMFNNWDTKDENTAIFKEGDTHYYLLGDLGSSFGRLPEEKNGKSGRSVNKPEHYARSKFIKEVRGDTLELHYNGKGDSVISEVRVEHARWLADLLMQLSDAQIADAFRAANYDAKESKMLTDAFKARIRQLDEATRATAGTTTAVR